MDASTGSPTSWLWDFGDGGSSTDQNPTHTYTTAGVYTVIMTASKEGSSDTKTRTDYITANVAANFTPATTIGGADLTVHFTDTSTGNPLTWDWDFGDGSPHDTTQNPSHTYTTAGSYTVTLIASRGALSDTETKINCVTVGITANFIGSPTDDDAPMLVAFTDTSKGVPTTWAWLFGDGGTSTLQNPSHTYTTAGQYTVQLTATRGISSGVEIKADYITVDPFTDFVGRPLSGYAPLVVQFSDRSIGSPTSWLWDFGDGYTSTDRYPVHSYKAEGFYTVTLTISRGLLTSTKTRDNYIEVSRFKVSTSDSAVPSYRGDTSKLSSSPQLGMAFPKEGGVRVSVPSKSTPPIEEGFTRPEGPAESFS